MLVHRKSLFSGKINVMDLPITESQMNLWRGGVLIQNAMPHLTASEREFTISGTTKEEWDRFFSENEDDGA